MYELNRLSCVCKEVDIYKNVGLRPPKMIMDYEHIHKP